MPLLVASLALLITAAALLLALLIVIVGWARQERALRRMQRRIAERAERGR